MNFTNFNKKILKVFNLATSKKVSNLNFLIAAFFLVITACNIQVADSTKTYFVQDQAPVLVYIEPNGVGDGSIKNPFGTLEQARDRVREFRLAGERRNIDFRSWHSRPFNSLQVDRKRGYKKNYY